MLHLRIHNLVCIHDELHCRFKPSKSIAALNQVQDNGYALLKNHNKLQDLSRLADVQLLLVKSLNFDEVMELILLETACCCRNRVGHGLGNHHVTFERVEVVKAVVEVRDLVRNSEVEGVEDKVLVLLGNT